MTMPPVVRRQPLVKQTYSAWVNIDNSVRKWHMSECRFLTFSLLPLFFLPFPSPQDYRPLVSHYGYANPLSSKG